MAHHPGCNDFRGMDAGLAETGDEFIETYLLRENDPFPINIYKDCLGCCLAYLTRDRHYTRVRTQPGSFYVHFPSGNPPDRFRIPSITGFAHVPQGPRGIRGQIATLSDPDLGDRLRRTFQESRTYQLYVAQGEAARGLSIGFPCSARMESVAIDVVDQNRHYDIADIKLNFADALLVERFRQISSLAAFEGYCMTPPGPDQGHAIEGRFQNLAMN